MLFRSQPPLDPTTEQLIRAAITEDVGSGDVTATYFVPADQQSRAVIMAREPGVMAGMGIAQRVFELMDERLQIQALKQDGEAFVKGDVLMEISGPTRGLLTGERTALNFLQRLCGVAAQTRRYVEAVKPHPVQIWDTRKTTPGWRLLEKAAVKAGGGTNHRMGLYDHVMVKDNHLLAEARLPELQQAIDAVHREHPGMRIELEADRLSQVENFLTLRGVDVIMLDNMNFAQMAEAVKLMRAGDRWMVRMPAQLAYKDEGDGRIPPNAAPIPAPVKALSDSGVSRIRSGPNSSSRPSVSCRCVIRRWHRLTTRPSSTRRLLTACWRSWTMRAIVAPRTTGSRAWAIAGLEAASAAPKTSSATMARAVVMEGMGRTEG